MQRPCVLLYRDVNHGQLNTRKVLKSNLIHDEDLVGLNAVANQETGHKAM